MTTIGVKGHYTGFIYTVLRHHISDGITHQLFHQICEILWKGKIQRQRVNSITRLENPWSAENCGPTYDVIIQGNMNYCQLPGNRIGDSDISSTANTCNCGSNMGRCWCSVWTRLQSWQMILYHSLVCRGSNISNISRCWCIFRARLWSWRQILYQSLICHVCRHWSWCWTRRRRSTGHSSFFLTGLTTMSNCQFSVAFAWNCIVSVTTTHQHIMMPFPQM